MISGNERLVTSRSPPLSNDESTSLADDQAHVTRFEYNPSKSILKWNNRLVVLSFAVGIVVLVWTRFILPDRNTSQISDRMVLRLRKLNISASASGIVAPSTYVRSGLRYRIANAPQPTRKADTTAIVLNWSRLDNVILISALLCDPSLHDTIAQVFVWNNNPNIKLNAEYFKETGCSGEKLRIYNSPSNLYFQARFLACAQSATRYCFIQDDDYLVQPEVIKNMHLYVLQHPSIGSLHILPAHEHLLSRLRSFTTEDGLISTTFAWLGHGTYADRSVIIEFIGLLRALDATEDEMKMADNYFTVLSNRLKEDEIWFDHGIELGGGQPFTVGTEGDTRNDRHMVRALEYLSALVSGQRPIIDSSYISKAETLATHDRVLYAPCRLNSCLVMSNIDIVPSLPHPIGLTTDMDSVMKRRRIRTLGADEREWYIQNSLSNLVDARPSTAFRSIKAAKEGDWITIDALGALDPGYGELELVVLFEEGMDQLLRQDCSFSTSEDGVIWTQMDSVMHCISVNKPETEEINLKECNVKGEHKARYFRIWFSGLNERHKPWVVYEMWLRNSPPANDL